MKQNIVDFFVAAGRLKKIKRRGALLYGKTEEDVESTAEHTYRLVLITWILGQKKNGLNIERAVKMALIHNLCEAYAGDITPYDNILPKSGKERYQFVRTWPGLSREEKEKRFKAKHKKEKRGLERIVAKLGDEPIAKEIMNLWLDYETCLSKEARFVKQLDRLENLLQAEGHYEEDGVFPTKPWWMHAREAIDDPLILEFMTILEKREMKVRASRGDLEI